MARLVVNGAMLQCDQGAAPSALVVPPSVKADAARAGLATVRHHQPNVNINTFGACRSTANPSVASATATAGKLTPMPCVPNTPSPWTDASSGADVNGAALLTEQSKCKCMWAGEITVVSSGTDAEAKR